jgi:predicted Zn-dependent protease
MEFQAQAPAGGPRFHQVTTMQSNTRFWIALTLFQVIFGFSVFAITRQFYQQESEKSRPRAVSATQAVPARSEGSAVSELEQLISRYPAETAIDDPDAMIQQADDFFANGQYDRAAELYERLLAAGSNSVDLYNNLGITLHYLGRSAEALQRLNEGAAIDPSYQRIWLTLGFVNGQIGHTQQARSALIKATELGADTQVGQSAAEMLQALGPE